MTNRRDRPREVLGASWAAVGRDGLAESVRAGKDSEWSKSAVAIDAMLSFADSELERAVQIADTGVTRCLQKVDGRGATDARWIRDAIRAMKETE